jgi:hypothetical protein
MSNNRNLGNLANRLDEGSTGEVLTKQADGSTQFAAAGDPDLYAENYDGTSTKPTAGGTNTVAIGKDATSSNSFTIALGQGANASGSGAGAFGRLSQATGGGSHAFGLQANSSGTYSTAIGRGSGVTATSTGTGSTAIGGSYASGTDSLAAAIANSTSSYGATGANSIALGDRSKSTGSRGIAIGGYGALASGASSLALGYQATANQSYASGFGYASKAYGDYSFAGTESHASGSKSVALGLGDTSTSYGALHDNGVALGYQATTSAAKQIALGSSTAQVKVSGAYTLPTADGTANQVLTTDGSGAVTFADAGGGADLYAENYDGTSTLPSATGTNSVAIGIEAESTGTNAIAIGRNATSNFGSVALGYNTQASSFYGAAIGANLAGSGALSSGVAAIALGASRANGSSSLSAMTENNTASYGALGSYSMALGFYSKTTTSKSFTLGSSCISGGEGGLATGFQTEVSAHYGRSGGCRSLANVAGDAWASGYFSATGDAQNVKLVIRGATSNTTPVILTTGGGAASGSRSLILETYSAYAFSLMVVARRDASDGTESAAVKIEGLIRKEGNDSSIALVNSNRTTISNAPSWTISVSATAGAAGEDNGGLDVVCADFVNGHNIRWVGTLKYTKVTYA